MPAYQYVFISHAHNDRQTATELQAILHSFGAETFLDQDYIQAGDHLDVKLEEGIFQCTVFLLLWSWSASSSKYVAKEWNKALDIRKKIVPYSLDNTPLPAVLDNLVRIDPSDRQLANAGLLKAIFGGGFAPDPTTLFPGNWQATVNTFGIGQGTYQLALRANGQVDGYGAMEQSGVAGGLAQSLGLDLSSFQIPVSGTWSYNHGTQTLTLTMAASGQGQVNSEIVNIKTTGKERGAIQGQDYGGRTWILQRTN